MMPLVLLLALGAEPLTLDEVVDGAERALPTLVATRFDVDAAQAEQLAANGAFDPSWKTRGVVTPISGYPQGRVDSYVEAPTPLWGTTFVAGYRYGAGKIQPYYGERETWTGGELRAGAVVPVVRNGPIDRRRASQARAELGLALSQLSVTAQRIELRRLATVRFYEWVAAGERREIARQLLRVAEDRDRQLEARTTVGDAAKIDRQDNLRALMQRRAGLVTAQRSLEQAAFELSLFLRDEKGEPVLPDEARLPRLPVHPTSLPGRSIADVIQLRPDVQRLINQRQQARVELRLAENQLLPAVDFGVFFSQDLGRAPRPETSALGAPELELTLSLDVPILYRAPLGRLGAARAGVSKLDAQIQFAQDRVAVELRDARSAFDAAKERTELAQQEVTVAADLERLERARFELGEGTLLFVNLREQTTAEARQREVDARLDSLRAEASYTAAAADLKDAS